MIYDVDFTLVADRNSPPSKRGPRFAAFFAALLAPLKFLRDDLFDTYRPDVSERTKYNSQTIVLEAILNKLAGLTVDPLIYIFNEFNLVEFNYYYGILEGYPATYFYNEDELPDTPVYFFNEDENVGAIDFTVYIPSASFATWEEPVRAETEKYKIAGVSFAVDSY